MRLAGPDLRCGYARAMQTVGIDLSARARKTGVAVLEAQDGRATVTELAVGGHTDANIRHLIEGSTKTGIDCPLGWPVSFVDFVSAHRGHADLPEDTGRDNLTHRATDRFVMEEAEVRPLAVSADRIGITAMHCARLLSGLETATVDRTGRTGPVVEVYPAAMLSMWKLRHQSYKEPKNASNRAHLVKKVQEKLPWLELGDHADLCRKTDDALDAVLCALMALLSEIGHVLDIPDEHLDEAQVEGWIALPRECLASLPI